VWRTCVFDFRRPLGEKKKKKRRGMRRSDVAKGNPEAGGSGGEGSEGLEKGSGNFRRRKRKGATSFLG